MSRSGYSEDCDGSELNLWRGAVASAIRGKRGQKFLRDLIAALDALPEKRLEESVLVSPNGCCAMGAVAIHQGLNTEEVDPYDRDQVADLFDISGALAAEIAFENDEEFSYNSSDNPEQRWRRMRKWAVRHLS